MVVMVREWEGSWEAWACLDEENVPPHGHNFIIAVEATRDEAIAKAIQELEWNADALRNRVIGERP